LCPHKGQVQGHGTSQKTADIALRRQLIDNSGYRKRIQRSVLHSTGWVFGIKKSRRNEKGERHSQSLALLFRLSVRHFEIRLLKIRKRQVVIALKIGCISLFKTYFLSFSRRHGVHSQSLHRMKGIGIEPLLHLNLGLTKQGFVILYRITRVESIPFAKGSLQHRVHDSLGTT